MRARLSPRRLAGIAAVLVATAATVGGLLQVRISTAVNSFLPASDPALTSLADKASSFGGDPIVVLLETKNPQGPLLDPQELPKLLNLEGELAKLPDVSAVDGPATMLNQIAISAQNLLSQLAGHRAGLQAAAEHQAREHGGGKAAVDAAGRAAVTGFDQRYGSLLVRGLPAGLPTLHNPGFVRAVVYDKTGAPRNEWRVVVPKPGTVAAFVRPTGNLAVEPTRRLVDAVRAAVGHAGLPTERVTITGMPAVSTGLADESQREIKLIGGLALGAIALCFLVVPGLGRRRHRLLPLGLTLAATAMTLAAFGWAHRPLSLGVVTFLPILLGIGSDLPLYLAGESRRRVVVTAAASAAGFSSLAVSPLPFVQELGVALASAMVLTVALAVLLRRRLRALRPPEPAEAPRRTGRPRPWQLAVLAGLAVIAALGWTMLPRITVNADPQQLADGTAALADAQHAQQILGFSGEISLALHGNDVLSPDALRWSRQAENAVVLRHGDQVRPILSAPDLLRFLGDSPTPAQINAAVQLMPDYLTAQVIRVDHQESLLQLGAKLQDIGQQRQLLDGLRSALPPAPPGARAELTGLPVAAARAYELIDENRYTANLLGIAVVGLVLAAGLRRRVLALHAVLTALLASGWILAAMWALGLSLSPLSVALGSLIAATGAEYSVFLDRSRWTARSVAVACLCATAGYLTLTASALSVLRDFGLLLAASVLAAYSAARAVTYLTSAPAPGGPPVNRTAHRTTEVAA